MFKSDFLHHKRAWSCCFRRITLNLKNMELKFLAWFFNFVWHFISNFPLPIPLVNIYDAFRPSCTLKRYRYLNKPWMFRPSLVALPILIGRAYFALQKRKTIRSTNLQSQSLPNSIVNTSILATFWYCLHVWWCQNWFIFSWIGKHLINCLH